MRLAARRLPRSSAPCYNTLLVMRRVRAGQDGAANAATVPHSPQLPAKGAVHVDEATAAPSATASDLDLVTLLRVQPADGIAALYDRYGRLVFSMALRVVQDRGAAEEITQDVFMRCWRNLDRYQPSQGSLASWLLSITHNRAIDELRSRRGKDSRREKI